MKQLQGPVDKDSKAVILGGDFNASPPVSEMNYIYRLNQSTGKFDGAGDFFSADQTDAKWFSVWPKGACREINQKKVACRSGQYTARSNYTSSSSIGDYSNTFDYVFFSRNAVPGGGLDPTLTAQVYVNQYSAHDMVVGSVEIRVPTPL